MSNFPVNTLISTPCCGLCGLCRRVSDMAMQAIDELPQNWVPEDTFGARLALVRQVRGWNVKQAASACGINPQTWANWEDGTDPRGLDRVARAISRAAGCDYHWLVAGGPLNSSCISALHAVPPAQGQMELALGDSAALVLA